MVAFKNLTATGGERRSPRPATPNVTMRRFCRAGINVQKQADATSTFEAPGWMQRAALA
jgi:hypothetical protein